MATIEQPAPPGSHRRRPAAIWWPIEDLTIDPRYQRELSQRFVDKIAGNYQAAKIGVLTCNMRQNGSQSGMVVVIDGQHRLAALRVLGHERAPCAIYEIASLEDEARLFAELQTERRNVKPYQRHRALLVAGDADALALQRVIDALPPLKLSTTGGGSRSFHVNCTQRLYSILRAGGEAHLERVLRVLRDAWQDDEGAYQTRLVSGMDVFIAVYPELADGELVKRLHRDSPVAVMRRADAAEPEAGTHTGHAAIAVARSIWDTYNHGRRQRLEYRLSMADLNTLRGQRSWRTRLVEHAEVTDAE